MGFQVGSAGVKLQHRSTLCSRVAVLTIFVYICYNKKEWQQATVPQVCLAEGTTAYVKLGEIAGSLLLEDMTPVWPDVHPSNFVNERNGRDCFKHTTLENTFVCPMDAANPSGMGGYDHPVVIHGADGCTLNSEKVVSWSLISGQFDSVPYEPRFRFKTDDSVTVGAVNECLKPGTSFEVRKEPNLVRNAEVCHAESKGNYMSKYVCHLESQGSTNAGYSGPVQIHGKECTLAATQIMQFAYVNSNSDVRFVFEMASEGLIDTVNECLPPGEEFTISYAVDKLETNNLALAEEFVGDLVRCAEDLFYSADRQVRKKTLTFSFTSIFTTSNCSFVS